LINVGQVLALGLQQSGGIESQVQPAVFVARNLSGMEL